MGSTTRRTVPVMTTDGMGVVSHAGTVLLVELADRIRLTALLGQATDGVRERRAGPNPAWVLIGVAVADAAVTISDIQTLADHQGLHGPAGTVASTPTIWRVLAGIDAAMLARIRQGRRQTRPQRTELATENPFPVGTHEDNRNHPTLPFRALSGY